METMTEQHQQQPIASVVVETQSSLSSDDNYNESLCKFKAALDDVREKAQTEVGGIVKEFAESERVLEPHNRTNLVCDTSFLDACRVWGVGAWRTVSLGMLPPIDVHCDPESTRSLYEALINGKPESLGTVHTRPLGDILYCAASYKHLDRESPHREISGQKMRFCTWERLVRAAQRLAMAFKMSQVVIWIDMVLDTRAMCDTEIRVSQEEWMRYGLVPYFLMPVIVARERDDFEDTSYVDPRRMDERMWLHMEQRAGLEGSGLCVSGVDDWTMEETIRALPEHLRYGSTPRHRAIWEQSGLLLGKQVSVLRSMRNILRDAADCRLWKRKVSWAPAMIIIVQWLLDHALSRLRNTEHAPTFALVGEDTNGTCARTYEPYDERISYEIKTSYRGAQALWDAHWNSDSILAHKTNKVELQEPWSGPRFDAAVDRRWNSFLAWMPGVHVTKPCTLNLGELNSFHYHEERTRWLVIGTEDADSCLAMALHKNQLDFYPGFLVVIIEPEEDDEQQVPRKATVRSWQKFYPEFIKMPQILHTRLWVLDRNKTSSLQFATAGKMLEAERRPEDEMNRDCMNLCTILFAQTELGKEWYKKNLPENSASRVSFTALLGSECLWK